MDSKKLEKLYNKNIKFKNIIKFITNPNSNNHRSYIIDNFFENYTFTKKYIITIIINEIFAKKNMGKDIELIKKIIDKIEKSSENNTIANLYLTTFHHILYKIFLKKNLDQNRLEILDHIKSKNYLAPILHTFIKNEKTKKQPIENTNIFTIAEEAKAEKNRLKAEKNRLAEKNKLKVEKNRLKEEKAVKAEKNRLAEQAKQVEKNRLAEEEKQAEKNRLKAIQAEKNRLAKNPKLKAKKKI